MGKTLLKIMENKYTPAPEHKTTVTDCPFCHAPKGYLCLDDCRLQELIYHKKQIQEIIEEEGENK